MCRLHFPSCSSQIADVGCYTTCVGPSIETVVIDKKYYTTCLSSTPADQDQSHSCTYDTYTGDFISALEGADCSKIFVEESLDVNGNPNACSAYGSCGKAKC